MIRMHAYPDGLVGLAAFCDTCGRQITENGFVIWNEERTSRKVIEWKVIHQGRCEPADRTSWPMSMAFDVEIIHLANSAGIDLKRAAAHAATMDMIG